MNESYIQDVVPAQTSPDLAVHYAVNTAIVCALVSFWAFQYMAWVPEVRKQSMFCGNCGSGTWWLA
jgi:hypothetical protein